MKNFILAVAALCISCNAWAMNAPVPSSPSNGLENAYSRQTFYWSSVTGANMYELEVDTTIAFNSPLRVVQTTGATSILVYNLHYGTHYYWRVRAKNTTTEEVSDWSAIWELNTDDKVVLRYADDPDPTQTYYPSQTLSWDIHCGSSGYVVEVDTAAGFNSPAKLREVISVVQSNDKGTTSTEMTNLYLGKMQYWRVRAFNKCDSSAWSETRRFHTLSKAVAQTPKDLTGAYTQQLFYWKYQRGLNNVIIEYDTVPTFDSPERKTVKSWGSCQDNSYTSISYLRFNTQYYWHVKSYHERDTTEWSDVLTFKTYARGALSTPADSSENLLTSVSLYFKYHKGVSVYQMQLDTVPTFDSPALQTRFESANSNDYAYGHYSNLLFGTTYYWRVRDCHQNDTSMWSEIRQFTTYDWGGLVSPSNGATGVYYDGVSLMFKYHTGISNYQIEVDTVATFDSPLLSRVIEGASSSTYAYRIYSDLLQETDYYWRVRDCHKNDTSGWSSVWKFTTKSTLPATTLVTPSNQTCGYDASAAAFSWTDVEGATGYRLQVADNGQFEPCVVDQTTTETSATLTLPEAAILYWRVQVLFPGGRSYWTPIWGVNTAGTTTELREGSEKLVQQARKLIKNGQVIIVRKEGWFDVLGRKMINTEW